LFVPGRRVSNYGKKTEYIEFQIRFIVMEALLMPKLDKVKVHILQKEP